MIRLFCLLFALLGTAATAQSLPERFSVVNVAQNDVLNIRSDPTVSSSIVGEFAPDTPNVEVLRQQDGWGHVGAGEGSGWVSMRYLAPNPIPAGELPRPMACYGTEPFWSLNFRALETRYQSMGEDAKVQTTQRESVAANGYLVELIESDTTSRTVLIDALPCSDGMSDRDFGMSIRMFTRPTEGNSVLSGCCTLQVN